LPLLPRQSLLPESVTGRGDRHVNTSAFAYRVLGSNHVISN